MARVLDITGLMEKWAGTDTAEEWDNAGLITGSYETEVSKILITLDITSDVMNTAIEGKVDLIISHHPPIFKPFKKLNDSILPIVVKEAIKHNIAIYTSHTNLDIAENGVSIALAEKLGLENAKVLVPLENNLFKFITFCPPEYTDRIRKAAGDAGAGIIGDYLYCSFISNGTGTFLPSGDASPFSGKRGELSLENEDRLEMIVPSGDIDRVIVETRKAHPYEEMAYDIVPLANKDTNKGYGAVGRLVTPVDRRDFAAFVAEKLDINSVSFSAEGPEKITIVAVMGGSGSKYISHAVNAGAEAFVAGEIGHHDFLDYSGKINLYDATHAGTESPVLSKIADKIRSSSIGVGIEIVEYNWKLNISEIFNHKRN